MSTRVLLLGRHPSSVGGVVSYLNALVRHLDQSVSVERFVTGRRPSGLARYAGPFVLIGDSLRLAMRLVKNRYDVVHINPSLNQAMVRDALLMLVLRLFHGKRVLVFVHGWEGSWADKISGSGICRRLTLACYGWAERVVVLATTFQRKLVSWGFDADRISIMTTLFDADLFKGVQPELYREAKRMLFMARMVKEKGMLIALEGFKSCRKVHDGVTLTLAGDGPSRGEVEAYIRANDLTDVVGLPGFAQGEAKRCLLLGSDIFVLPTSHGEGCPVSLLEAMAAGMAVVVTAVGGIPDVFRDRVNGVLLKRADPQAVAAALNWLLEDPVRLAAIRRQNHAEAWAKYQGPIVAARMAAMYRTVAARKM